jgi:hypothetical protein
MNHYERNHQIIGRWTVFLRGEDVIMQTAVFENNRKRLIERNLDAQEALLFLAWLSAQEDQLYQAAARQKREAAE